jgi:hypothetical protein
MLLCTFHIGKSLVPLYAEPLGNPETVVTMIPGFSSGYVSLASGSLRAWLDKMAPGWEPPLIMVGWSAGCFAIREWLLNDPEAHSLIDAAVLLDGLHSSGPPCNERQINGALSFSNDPSKLLIVTHTAIVPPGYASTTDCADLLRRLSWGAVVKGYPGDDEAAHVRQVREIGPKMMGRVARWLRGPSATVIGIAVGGVAVAAMCAWYVLRR